MAFRLGECLLLDRIKEKGWTQAEFARRMKVSPQYINGLIAGRETMSLIFAINASFLLDCEISDIYVLEIDSDRPE